MDSYLPWPIIHAMYEYMTWYDLKYYTNVSSEIWKKHLSNLKIPYPASLDYKTQLFKCTDKQLKLCRTKQINKVSLWFDKSFVLAALKCDSRVLCYTPEAFKDDKEVMMTAVELHHNALNYASARLQDNKEVVLKAVNTYASALKYASPRLQDNEEVVMTAVKNYGSALNYASSRLKDDKEIVMMAVRRYFVL